MADNQEWGQLGDYFSLQRGTTYKSKLLGQSGPVLLGLASIGRDGGFRSDSLRTYGGESPDNLCVFPGELFVSLKDVTQSGDLLGSVARLPETIRVGRLTQDTVKLIPRSNDVPTAYLYWLMRTPQYRAYCRSHSTGTTNLGLGRDDFLSYPVPKLDEMRSQIVDTLENIEQKIFSNHEVNRTLEAMARAIFKAWFVDFEPVKAKGAGATSFCGMPQAVFDQLPDRFTETELGPVPDGWEVARLDQLVEINPKRPLRKGEEAPYLAMSEMPTRGHHPESWDTRSLGSGVKFQNGDTLVARITPCLENGKTAFVDFLRDEEVGWGSTEYIVLRPRAPLPAIYAYCLARSTAFGDFAIANMTGTSGRQRVPASAIAEFKVARPPDPLAKAFGSAAEQMFAMIAGNHSVMRTLAAIRDALLRKLISGELRVPVVAGGADGF